MVAILFENMLSMNSIIPIEKRIQKKNFKFFIIQELQKRDLKLDYVYGVFNKISGAYVFYNDVTENDRYRLVNEGIQTKVFADNFFDQNAFLSI